MSRGVKFEASICLLVERLPDVLLLLRKWQCCHDFCLCEGFPLLSLP